MLTHKPPSVTVVVVQVRVPLGPHVKKPSNQSSASGWPDGFLPRIPAFTTLNADWLYMYESLKGFLKLKDRETQLKTDKQYLL